MEVIREESTVVDQITEYAEKNDIDLIVIGIRSVSEFS
jgi:nucleotide-binding universal stress UspA family protein